MNDAYRGGERNAGKAGRGSDNKIPFVMALELSSLRRGIRNRR